MSTSAATLGRSTLRWFSASAFVTLAVIASIWRSYDRPLSFAFAGHHLYGVVIDRGQLQLFVGTQTILRYPNSSTVSPVVPQIVEVGWNEGATGSLLHGVAPPTLGTFRLTMSSWPPFKETASFLAGGQISVPVRSPPGGFRIGYSDFGWKLDARAISVWLVLAIVATPTMILGLRLWRRRDRAGHCPACGYDLRASPERCPECGRVTSTLAEG